MWQSGKHRGTDLNYQFTTICWNIQQYAIIVLGGTFAWKYMLRGTKSLFANLIDITSSLHQLPQHLHFTLFNLTHLWSMVSSYTPEDSSILSPTLRRTLLNITWDASLEVLLKFFTPSNLRIILNIYGNLDYSLYTTFGGSWRKKDFKYFWILLKVRLYFEIYKLVNQGFQDYIPCLFNFVFNEATPLKQVFSGFCDFPVVWISF